MFQRQRGGMVELLLIYHSWGNLEFDALSYIYRWLRPVEYWE